MYGVSGSSVHGRCSTWAYGARVLCLTSWSHLRLSQTRWLSACACASLGVSPTIGASLPWLLPRAHPCSPLYARYAALSTLPLTLASLGLSLFQQHAVATHWAEGRGKPRSLPVGDNRLSMTGCLAQALEEAAAVRGPAPALSHSCPLTHRADTTDLGPTGMQLRLAWDGTGGACS